MSFAADQDDDELSQDDQESNKNATDPTVSLGGGGSGTASPSGGNVGGNNANATPQSERPVSQGGAWTNLQQYLNSNSDQAAQAGQDVAGSVNKQAQTASNDIDSAAKDFSNQVSAGEVEPDQGAVQQGLDATSTPLIKSHAIMSPGDGTQPGSDQSLIDPNIASNFQRQYNATYNGPTDFTKDGGYTQAANDLNNAQTQLGETQSEAGRDVLLNNQYSNASQNGYNQGERTLDQALIQGSPAAQAALQGVSNQWNGIGGALGNATNTQNAVAQQAATDTATAQANARSAYDTTNNQFQSGVNSQVTAAQAKQQADYAAIQSALTSNQLTSDQLASLGLSAGQHTYGVNIASPQYLAQGSSPTLANVANKDQYSQALALAQLIGQTDSSFLPQSESGQASGVSPYSYNTSGLNSDIATAKQEAENQAQNYYNQVAGGLSFGDPIQGAALANENDIYQGNPMQYANAIPSQWQALQDELSSTIGLKQ